MRVLMVSNGWLADAANTPPAAPAATIAADGEWPDSLSAS